MQIETRDINGVEVAVKVFESVSEFADLVKSTSDKNPVFRTLLQGRVGDTIDFLGRELGGISGLMEKIDGVWQDGLDTLAEMMKQLRDVEMPSPVQRTRRTRFNEDSGDEVDHDRLRAGNPEFWRDSFRQPCYGSPVIVINAMIHMPCSLEHGQAIWRGAAAIAMATILESAGYSVELWATNEVIAGDKHCPGGDSAGRCFATVKLKAAGDPINESSLVNAISTWFMRTMFFSSYYLVNGGNHLQGGHFGLQIGRGIGETFRHVVGEPDITIEDVYSLTAAVGAVKHELNAICEKAKAI